MKNKEYDMKKYTSETLIRKYMAINIFIVIMIILLWLNAWYRTFPHLSLPCLTVQ
jgi:hypothetical protein